MTFYEIIGYILMVQGIKSFLLPSLFFKVC